MIYITNQFYVNVVTYVTITSNRMTVPTTSINYIKYSSIKGLFDKFGKKKYNSLIHITCSTFILEVACRERRIYFILLAFFSCECCYYMCNNSNTKSYDKWKSWVKTIKYSFNWNIFLPKENNNTFLTRKSDFISLGQFHHSMWVS